jgi:hypothetical protein
MIFNYVTSAATISARLPARAEDPLEHGTSHAIKTVWDTTPVHLLNMYKVTSSLSSSSCFSKLVNDPSHEYLFMEMI